LVRLFLQNLRLALILLRLSVCTTPIDYQCEFCSMTVTSSQAPTSRGHARGDIILPHPGLFRIVSHRVPMYRRIIYFCLNGRDQHTHSLSLSHSHSLFFFKIYMLLSFLSCLRSILLFLVFLFRTRMKYITLKKKKNSKKIQGCCGD
jgi:hypothetical protein